MDYRVKLKEENEAMRERFDLATERIEQILSEDSVKEPYLDYFHKVTEFIIKMKAVFLRVESGEYANLSLEELQSVNKDLYEDIIDRKSVV